MEDSIAAYYEVLKDTSNFTESSITLDKKRHALFLRKGLRKLSQGFVVSSIIGIMLSDFMILYIYIYIYIFILENILNSVFRIVFLRIR